MTGGEKYVPGGSAAPSAAAGAAGPAMPDSRRWGERLSSDGGGSGCRLEYG